jgi:hypothetical protein
MSMEIMVVFQKYSQFAYEFSVLKLVLLEESVAVRGEAVQVSSVVDKLQKNSNICKNYFI